MADQPIGDELLALLFVACHPVLPPSSRAALDLRLLGGLTTEEIARAYLVPSATHRRANLRAKRTLSEAHVPFVIPEPEVAGRRDSGRCSQALVPDLQRGLCGHVRATVGSWPDLAEEAMRLGRVLAGRRDASPRSADWLR